MEREGIATDLGDKNREITERNQVLEERLREQAATQSEIAQEQARALEEPEAFFSYCPIFPAGAAIIAGGARASGCECVHGRRVAGIFPAGAALAFGTGNENERRWYDPFYSTIESIQKRPSVTGQENFRLLATVRQER